MRPVADALGSDLRAAFRSLRATPGVTAVAVLCLGLGIGANTSMFSVADRLFLRPPPGVGDAAAVVRVSLERTQGSIRSPGSGSYPDYTDLQNNGSHVFTGVAAFSGGRLSYGVGADAHQWQGEYVSQGYFSTLGVHPAIGRFFLPQEDTSHIGVPVAVLSYACWQRQFAGDRHIVGRSIQLEGRAFTVVGVAAQGFSGINLQPLDVWVPLAEFARSMGPEALSERHVVWLDYVARLAPGVHAEDAARIATAIKRRIDPAVATDLDKNVRVLISPIQRGLTPTPDPQATMALWVSAAVTLVLLIACANVANLLLARGSSRRRELAVRLSLGARRSQIVRQLMVESLVLSFGGGVLGLLFCTWASGAATLFGLPPSSTGLDARAIAFTAGVALLTALTFGLAPALASTRSEVASALRDGRGASHRRFSLQRGLLGLQAALSLVVVVAAGLFVRSLRNVRAIDLGLDVAHVLTVTIPLAESGLDSAARVAFYDRVLERLSSVHGVAAAAYEGIPSFEGMMGLTVTLPGQDTVVRDRRGFSLNFVGPGFLRAYGTRLDKGRDITAADRAGTLPVAVVNETMARRLWPGKDAVGQCMQVSLPGPSKAPPSCTYVVGIMADGKYQEVTESPAAYFLLPRTQRDYGFQPTLIVRTVGDPYQLTGAIRQAVIAIAPNLPYIDVRPIADRLDPQLQPYRLGALLFTAFGGIALLLAAIGLYGVVAYVVTQRTREAGIRLALGARAANVLFLMLQEGFVPALAGAALGIAGALTVARFLRSQLYGVSPTDPATVIIGTVLLATIAGIACSIPARRATRIDPVIALRSE